MVRLKRWISATLGSLALHAAAAIDFPYPLDDPHHLLQAQISLNGAPPVTAQDAFSVNLPSGTSFVRGDYGTGALRGRAQVADSFGTGVQADIGLTLRLTNQSNVTASLAPGVLKLDLNASFSRSLGVDLLDGLAANTLVATMAAVRLNAANHTLDSGFANLLYSVKQMAKEPVPVHTLDQQFEGGFSAGPLVSTPSQLSVKLLAPELTLAPGDILALTISVSGAATAFGFTGGPGFSATTDFGNTAQLSLSLPPGFTILSDTPLSWVTLTPIPESPTALLLGLGLGLAALARVRGRRAPATSALGAAPQGVQG